MYKAICDKDSNVFKCGKVGNTLGYKRVNIYFVDNSGFGSDSEPALTANSFLDKVKAGYYYAIISVGQFQVYIGEYEKTSRKEAFNKEGILKSKKISKSARVTEYINGDKIISLYQTEILKIQGDKIILNSGGHQTHTTKRRINQFLPADIYLYQKDFTWYIKKDGKEIEFYDNI
jgi:hypothetical protein